MKRRWMMRIVFCLILGTITTVAVAWGCAAFSNLGESRGIAVDLPRGHEVHLMLVLQRRGIGRERLALSDFLLGAKEVRETGQYVGDRSSSVGPYGTYPYEPLPASSRLGWSAEQLNVRIEEEELTGWPSKAIWAGCTEYRAGERYIVQSPYALHFDHWTTTYSGGQRYSERALGYLPIWPGFVIDTLFYAAIWFGVFFAPGSAKRFIRVRRGRCPRCGYDLRGNRHAGCPECGWNRTVTPGQSIQ